MMSVRAPFGGGGGGFGGLAGPPPRDVVVLVATVFVTWSLQFFSGPDALVRLLRLTPDVFRGFVWQPVTYAFVGVGGASLWILLELLILYWFAKDVFWRLGRRRFWRTLVIAAVAASLAAVLVQLLMLAFGAIGPSAFGLMQGQRMLLAIVIAAFATLFGDATILLFFVLPVRARWFLWLEILFAFVAFLGSGDPRFGVPKDLAGFVGICAAVAATYLLLSPGGPQRTLHNLRKRLEVRWIQWRLKQLRRKRPFDVIDGGDDRDRWVH
jgi:membrane associated rhomboid family serine protease